MAAEIPEVVIPPEARQNPVAYLVRAGVTHAPIFRRLTPPRQQARYGRWQVYLVGPDANRFVMHTHRQLFSHAQGWRAYFGGMWNDNLLYLDHADHAAHRKVMAPAFAPAALARYLPMLHQLVDHRTRDWGARDVVEIRAELRDLAFDCVAAALLGFPPGAAITELHALRDAVSRNRNPFGKRAYYAHIATTRAALNAKLSDLLAAHGQQGQRDLTTLLLAGAAGCDAVIDEEHLFGHLHVMLEAGHTTTMDTATWVVGLLATHPAYLARVRAEADAVLGGSGTITLEATKQMPIIGRAIDEAARLRTPVDTAPRGALTDIDFAGYTIPQGTFVRLHLGACHRLPEIFDQPDCFDPDRFAPPREEQKRTPYALVPFGGGPRVCIGLGFARAEITALVAHLARTYDIAPIVGVTPTNVWDTAELDDSLPHGLPLRFTPRAR